MQAPIDFCDQHVLYTRRSGLRSRPHPRVAVGGSVATLARKIQEVWQAKYSNIQKLHRRRTALTVPETTIRCVNSPSSDTEKTKKRGKKEKKNYTSSLDIRFLARLCDHADKGPQVCARLCRQRRPATGARGQEAQGRISQRHAPPRGRQVLLEAVCARPRRPPMDNLHCRAWQHGQQVRSPPRSSPLPPIFA